MHRHAICVDTRGRGLYELTPQVSRVVAESGINDGFCHLFIRHTSASLVIGENADPCAIRDLEAFMCRLVPDADALFQHVEEGVDDMPAHIRSILTQVSLLIPVESGRCALGKWQGLFVWEHRLQSHRRELVVSVWNG